MDKANHTRKRAPWQISLDEIIFGHKTPAGKAFDVALLCIILLSVAVVMLESVASIRANYESSLLAAEWVFTCLFTLEYFLRLSCVPHRRRYALSFFGIIDLLAVLPTYANLFLAGAHYLMIIRILRLLRIFRILKMVRYLSEAHVLITALRASRIKITVFLGTVATLVIIMGALMYLIEGEKHGFTSIPRSVYWAIVTLTTVGYGDIAPQTNLGQFLACLVMIMGYGIIAVPTGIVSVELHQATQQLSLNRPCLACGATNHSNDALYCRRCSVKLKTST